MLITIARNSSRDARKTIKKKTTWRSDDDYGRSDDDCGAQKSVLFSPVMLAAVDLKCHEIYFVFTFFVYIFGNSS